MSDAFLLRPPPPPPDFLLYLLLNKNTVAPKISNTKSDTTTPMIIGFALVEATPEVEAREVEEGRVTVAVMEEGETEVAGWTERAEDLDELELEEEEVVEEVCWLTGVTCVCCTTTGVDEVVGVGVAACACWVEVVLGPVTTVTVTIGTSAFALFALGSAFAFALLALELELVMMTPPLLDSVTVWPLALVTTTFCLRRGVRSVGTNISGSSAVRRELGECTGWIKGTADPWFDE